jgi:branched-chain amino acid transport system permease protein
MDFFTQLLVSGLSVGFLYGLSAMGFVMIFKSSSVLNFAHGELLALGAYFFLALVTWAKLPILLAFLLTLAGCFLLGILIERIFLRPLIGEPLIFIIMLTVGLAAMFKGLILLIWGGNLYTYPDFLPKVLKRVFALSWAIAALVAGMSGLVLGIINGVNVHNLSAIGLKVFPVIILGGLDSIGGAIIGGLIIGLLETFTGGYISPSLRDVVPYIVLVVILLIKPYGLFGLKEIERV